MKMHDPATRFIMAEIAQDRRMVTIGDGGKELETALEEDRLGAVLIPFCDKQIEISVAGQAAVNSIAALPVEVGDVVLIKVVQDSKNELQDGALGGRATTGRVCPVLDILSHLSCPFRPDDLAMSNA
jgi:hypothetical protein